ncbi:MAG: CDP-glucose 4,6-dehydratase [Lachnospiraceae bacterium]|nr:CDP-glucose 4,6-dehydratase [Lachnospiraceae bacterium]
MLKEFYKGKKVLITGHTGFKGAWMCSVLHRLGAEVIGYAMEPPTNPSLYDLSCVDSYITSVIGDIRDLDKLQSVFNEYQPEIVIHMAAQPIVRESYKNPVYTYDVNVMGTVNVLECVRNCKSVKSFLNVTTDKVYKNREWEWGYRENEELNGFEPYSNSKSCSELVTESYKNSFFADGKVAVSTARAGNVIGGGDFAVDRIIPDCMRAVISGKDIVVRNPHSVRPYQHVLEPVFAYLLIAKEQYEEIVKAGNYNIGPDEVSCVTTGEIVGTFCRKWNASTQSEIFWRIEGDGGPHEANFLKLDCSKMKQQFGWRPVWNYEQAIEKTVEWVKTYISGGDIALIMREQIEEYTSKC